MLGVTVGRAMASSSVGPTNTRAKNRDVDMMNLPAAEVGGGMHYVHVFSNLQGWLSSAGVRLP
jgi:hypothetical protein